MGTTTFLNRSYSLLEDQMDEILPIYFSDCLKTTCTMAEINDVRYNENIVDEMMRSKFREIPLKLLSWLDEKMNDYAKHMNNENEIEKVLEDFKYSLEDEFGNKVKYCFDDAYEDFTQQFNIDYKPQSENEGDFKRRLITRLEEKKDTAVWDLCSGYRKVALKEIENFKASNLEENKVEETVEDNNNDMNIIMQEIEQFLGNASDSFIANYQANMNLLNEIKTASPEEAIELQERFSSNVKLMQPELELLKQGYTKTDYHEDFDGMILNEQMTR